MKRDSAGSAAAASLPPDAGLTAAPAPGDHVSGDHVSGAPVSGDHAVSGHTEGRSAWWPGSPEGRFDDPASLTLASLFAGADLPRTDAGLDTAARALTIELVKDEAILAEVVALRERVYSRHERPLKIRLEALDTAPRTAVLVVRDEAGELFATMRVTFSDDGGEAWRDRYRIPESYRQWRIASFERLAIDRGGATAIRAKQLLFKAAYLLTIGSGVHWIIISTVHPLNRLFESLGFTNLFGQGATVQLDWFGTPQHVLAMPTDELALPLLRANRKWYDLIVTHDARLEALLGRYFSTLEPT